MTAGLLHCLCWKEAKHHSTLLGVISVEGTFLFTFKAGKIRQNHSKKLLKYCLKISKVPKLPQFFHETFQTCWNIKHALKVCIQVFKHTVVTQRDFAGFKKRGKSALMWPNNRIHAESNFSKTKTFKFFVICTTITVMQSWNSCSAGSRKENYINIFKKKMTQISL